MLGAFEQYFNISFYLQNKTLFNSCERLLLGTLILDIDIGVEYLRSEQIVLPYLLDNGEQT